VTHDPPQPHTPTDDAAQAALYRLVVENAMDLIVRGDANDNRVFVSPSSQEILGYAPEELIGRHGFTLVHPDDLARVDKIFHTVGPAKPRVDATFRMRRKDGSYIWVEACYRYLPCDGGRLAILRDITKRKRVEDMLAEANEKLEAANLVLQRLAQQDGLTGLANRRHFDELLEAEFRRAVRQELPIALVLLDVDHFKSFNDCYGHLAGDACLRSISRAVADVLRRPGDLAARFGGEEIGVILPATDASGAVAIAEKMRLAVSALCVAHLGSRTGFATISAGVSAIIPFEADTASALVAEADRALYRAKAEGRNTVRDSRVRRCADSIELQK